VATRHDLVKQLAPAAQLHDLQQHKQAAGRWCSWVAASLLRRLLHAIVCRTNQTAYKRSRGTLKMQSMQTDAKSSSARRQSGRPAQALTR
jgi:hypothetical protein